MTTNQIDRIDRIEALLENLIKVSVDSSAKMTDKIDQLEQKIDDTNNKIDLLEQRLEKKIDDIDEKLKTLDGRFFELSMRIVNVNYTAYWSVAIVILSAAIAFFVSRVNVQ